MIKYSAQDWSEITSTKGQSAVKSGKCKYCGEEFYSYKHGGKGGRLREICLNPSCERKREQENRQRRYEVLKRKGDENNDH